MTAFISGLRMLIRLAFLVLLLLGLYIWFAGAGDLAGIHIGIGFVFVLLVLTLAVFAGIARAGVGLVVITAVWAICIPVIGIAQLNLMPGNLHWVIRLLHLLVALGVMPFAERLAHRVLEARAKQRASAA